MSEELDLSGRVKVLEHGIHKLENSFESRFTSLEKSIARLTENLQGRPVTPPFKEIIISISATLAIVMIVAGVIGSYVDKSIALSNAESSRSQAVIEYRLDQLEKPHGRTSSFVMVPTNPTR